VVENNRWWEERDAKTGEGSSLSPDVAMDKIEAKAHRFIVPPISWNRGKTSTVKKGCGDME
jgi:hypothetical protein